MAKQIERSHTYEMDRDDYIDRVFLNDAYNEAMHTFLEFVSREVIAKREEDGVVEMTIDCVSGERLPLVARKLYGGEYIGWVEAFTLDRRTYRSSSEMTPKVLGKRVKINVCIQFREPRPGTVTHHTTCAVKVSVPIVGGAIADKMLKDMARNLEKSFAWTEGWLVEQGLIGASASDVAAGAAGAADVTDAAASHPA